MNIFILDGDTDLCAMYHCDKHVVKMITEYNQLLSTACNLSGLAHESIYKSTHINHPCNVWTRSSRSNFLYLIKLNESLLKEYTYRYNKIHKGTFLIEYFKKVAYTFDDIGLTPFPVCMPDDCKLDNVVNSYRNFYRIYKRSFCTWKNRPVPYWFND